jgi:thiol-disulfide isomerase/thioredoxin
MLNSLLIITGIWRGVLMTAGGELPFNIHVESRNDKYSFTILNGTDSIMMREPVFRNDSVIIDFPVYETSLHARVISEDSLSGYYINHTKASDNTIPFHAKANTDYRFRNSAVHKGQSISGKYRVVFGSGASSSDSAVAVMNFNEGKLLGTFMKTTGDYRYLEGVVTSDSMYLSGFDGVFVYLFKGRVSNDTIYGNFWSGANPGKKWYAVKDPDARLPDPEQITSISDPLSLAAFRFLNTDSVLVGLNDPGFRNKIVVIQILGTWCPNCLDESRFLAPLYERKKGEGLEIIGLAFEKTGDFRRASANVKRMAERLNITYPILIASDRSKIRETLPQLDNFIAFPTVIVLDRSHRVRKVHAGFSGPATGDPYLEYTKKFSETIDELLKE